MGSFMANVALESDRSKFRLQLYDLLTLFFSPLQFLQLLNENSDCHTL